MFIEFQLVVAFLSGKKK